MSWGAGEQGRVSTTCLGAISAQMLGALGRVFKWLLLSSLADHHIRTTPVPPPWAWQACRLQRGLPPVMLQRLQDRPRGQPGLGVPTQACMTLVLPNLCPPAAATGNPHLSIALTCWPVAMGTGV